MDTKLATGGSRYTADPLARGPGTSGPFLPRLVHLVDEIQGGRWLLCRLLCEP